MPCPHPHLQYYRLSSFCTWGPGDNVGARGGGADVRWRRAHRAPFLSLHLCAVQMNIISLLVVIFVVQNMNIWVCCHRESSCRLSFTHPPPKLHSHTETPRFIGCCLAPKLFMGSLVLFQRELVEYIKNQKKNVFLSRSGIMTRTEEQNQFSGVPPRRKKEDRQICVLFQNLKSADRALLFFPAWSSCNWLHWWIFHWRTWQTVCDGTVRH